MVVISVGIDTGWGAFGGVRGSGGVAIETNTLSVSYIGRQRKQSSFITTGTRDYDMVVADKTERMSFIP